jgi:hypothetical protein
LLKGDERNQVKLLDNFGRHAALVPESPRENARFRRSLLRKATQDPWLRQELRKACKEDPVFYLNAFAHTYDPRPARKAIRFVCWPFQRDAVHTMIECVVKGQDLVIAKSRDMGASWMSLYVMEWMWHWHDHFSFLMVSRKEDLVDKPGDPDSLFWKIDFLHKHMPNWLMPKGWEPRQHRKKLHYENPETDSTIDGESTNTAAGVGGRRTAMFIDEFSRIDEAQQLLAGTADTTNCRIFNFTPWGTTNAAYELYQHPEKRKLRLHWSQHPHKAKGLYHYDKSNKRLVADDTSYEFGPDYEFILDGKQRSPWYDQQCLHRSESEIAQMLDIDFGGSKRSVFDQTMIAELQKAYCRQPVWEGDVLLDPDTSHPMGLEQSPGGPLKLWIEPLPGGRWTFPEADYVAGADLSTGVGSTNSVGAFANANTGEKVAEYVSPHLRPDQMASRLVAICRLFRGPNGPARLAWEHQGPGVPFGRKVMDLGFMHVYWRSYENKAVKKQVDTPGWVPTNEAKIVLIEQYNAALRSREFLNPSHLALEECLRFEYVEQGVEYVEPPFSRDKVTGKTDPSGAKVNHGDRVIADALCWKMVKERGRIVTPKSKEVARPGTLAYRHKMHEAQERELEEAWE